MRKWLPRIGISVLLIVIVAGIGFAAWGINGLPPSSEAQAALVSDATVHVTDAGDLITFQAVNGTPTTGFIFYPGARVLPGAYSIPMRAIALQGYATFIVKMPLNFAIFGVNRADAVIKANPQIKTWVIGGHSLGGSMAAQYVAGSEAIKGLVFWASYPATDLTKKNIVVLSLFGSEDGVVRKTMADDAQKLLPAGAQRITVEGGNHAYFGSYGAQDGDQPATAPREQVNGQIIDATVAFLKQVGG